MMRIFSPFHPTMSTGSILTYVLLFGAILFPQASSDDLRKHYSQGIQKADFQNSSIFLQKFIQRLPPLAERNYQDKLVHQAASEQKSNNELKSGGNGPSRKQWFIIGGTVIIALLIILATIILCMCNKEKKKKKRQRALAKVIHAEHPSDPAVQLNVDNLQFSFSPPGSGIAIAEINVADSINFQENSEQDVVTKFQEIPPNLSTYNNEVFPSTSAASKEIEIYVSNKIEDLGPIVESATQTMPEVSNVSPTNGTTNVSRENRQVKEEGYLSRDPQLYKNEGNQKVSNTDNDRLRIAKLPRKRYDSDGGTSDIDPRRRDQYMREYDRGYDSDQSRYGHENAAYDQYPEPRARAHYGIPRLESIQTDERLANLREERRKGHQHYSEIYSNGQSLQRRHEPPRRIEDYGERDVRPMHRDNDSRHYYPKYNDRYSRRPNAQINQHSRYKDNDDYYAITIKDSRYKDPFSRDVRRELGAVISMSSFNQNDRLKKIVDVPVRRNSYTVYTSPKVPQQDYKEHRENQPLKSVNSSASPKAISLPEPDYLLKGEEEPRVSPPSKKPPIVYHKPVVHTVVKPREFKGPYGPEDLDELNNPYTMARGKTQRPAIDNE